MSEQVVPAHRSPGPVELDLTALDWSTHSETLAPIRRHRLVGRRSRFIDGVTRVHAAESTRISGLIDLVVLALVSLALPVVPLWFRIGYPFAAVAAGYLGQVYSERDTVQTRGVLWYPGRLVAPLTAVAALPVAFGAVGVTSAVTLEVGAFVALTALRCLTWVVILSARRRGAGLRRTLIIGNAGPAATVWRRLVEFPEAGLLPTQLLTLDTPQSPDTVQRALEDWQIEHVVVVAPVREEALLAGALPRQAHNAPYFSAVPPLTELFLDPRSITEVGGIPLIPLGRATRLRHRFPGKRAFDLVCSGLLLMFAAPLLGLIALAIKLDDGGPVLFRQTRVGRGGEIFQIVKFRTMVVGADKMLGDLIDDNITDGLLFKLRTDPRITRLGAFLRKSSLDELPQLWNVARGQMSMVGPRPLAVEPHEFSPGDSERHTVLPGITGYWQLSGGPELSYSEMIRLDLAYIRNWSLWLDLRLVLRTVPALLHRHGAV